MRRGTLSGANFPPTLKSIKLPSPCPPQNTKQNERKDRKDKRKKERKKEKEKKRKRKIKRKIKKKRKKKKRKPFRCLNPTHCNTMDSSTPLPASAASTSSGPERDQESSSSEGYSSLPSSPSLSRSHSTASSSSAAAAHARTQAQESDDWGEMFPPLDKLTIFDYLDQLALPQRLEKINRTYLLQKDKVKRGFQQTKAKAMRKTDLELERYREKYSKGLDRVLQRWNDTKVVSTREKISFVVGVSNVFITGVLIGGYPLVFPRLSQEKRLMIIFREWMHIWYSIQLLYFMPIRYYTYQKAGYHYFLGASSPASPPPPPPSRSLTWLQPICAISSTSCCCWPSGCSPTRGG